MVIQDILIMLLCAGFIPSLIPSIRTSSKPAKSTCLLTGILLFGLAVVFLTMELWLSAGIDFITSGLWFFLLWQQRSKRG
jgi:hypothetical protein